MSGSGGGDDDPGHPPPQPGAGSGVVPFENAKTGGVQTARGRMVAMAGHVKELERQRDELVRRHGPLNPKLQIDGLSRRGAGEAGEMKWCQYTKPSVLIPKT